MSQQLDKVIQIFKEEKGFQRLFSLFYEKYRSYERIEKGISISIENPTKDEKNAIGGLMGLDYSKKSEIKITASKFEKALKNTVFEKAISDITLQEIVQAYFGEELISKKKEHNIFVEERDTFFLSYTLLPHSELMKKVIQWLSKEENKNNRYYYLYKQDRMELQRIMDDISTLLSMFPLQEPIYLPIFSSMVTKNPHSFDMDKDRGKILLYTLQVLEEIEYGKQISNKQDAEEISALLFKYNILRDDLFNYVTVYNVLGRKQDGEESKLLKGLQDEQSVINLPLREVMDLSEITASNNKIFMVENSSVASYLISETKKTGINVSIVSGNGMLNIATLRFLDIFVESGGLVYYAGDFDPEGLMIAQKLLQRYDSAMKLWSMGTVDYGLALSNEYITASSLSKLINSVKHPSLMELKDEILKQKKAGFSENLLSKLLKGLEIG
ncbi:hypothetical protein AJ85_18055 [Alkalihalobacillus alcalophilus ATCC 27647 = CGMCC 1.3604]|uniref:TIGR02679 family protein n=1 Tax=Alkalihalobacillus alcalophilus ATCC 27647 = CGMCC 1.3604 TaxID=1218173 RepID=A0A094WIV6_ALKAL|nr:TIGR02679 domain-containing protein [Alkalihalobacillus alcalophilus]KGA95878.1 hypothetical protein BALCAV_0219705 [Alkalihalobacillus alcalophilus ATCC 27647 = CGMCC 1.3604]MED1560559.1 TIGR02679 domain-containing protein [Alkalihalobacillus alcalophilus]THG89370.1 hypothetical protein AJ85_18055 [Alkalihalobacillus alcalophilus ATCC 27647 = CGMCC 1.3604]